IRPELDSKQIDSTDSASGAKSLSIGKSASIVYAFPQLLSSSRVQFWFRVQSPTDEDQTEGDLAVNLDFQTESGSTSWTMRATSSHAWLDGSEPDSLSTRQRVSLKPGWHCCTVLCADAPMIYVVDQALLLSAPRSPGKLKSIRVTSTQQAWID